MVFFGVFFACMRRDNRLPAQDGRTRAAERTRSADLGLVGVSPIACLPTSPAPRAPVHGTPRTRPSAFILAYVPSLLRAVRAVTPEADAHCSKIMPAI